MNTIDRNQTRTVGPTESSTTRIDAALAVLRVVVGAVFLAHGAQKLFVFGIPGLIEGFGGMTSA